MLLTEASPHPSWFPHPGPFWPGMGFPIRSVARGVDGLWCSQRALSGVLAFFRMPGLLRHSGN